MSNSISPMDLITNDKCLCVVNTSGGKDSHAMSIYMQRVWKAMNLDPKRLVFIHSTLGIAEWGGVIDAIKDQITGDHELHIVRANKTFLEMTLRSGKWPSPGFRQCTSDLKRGPIQSLIKKLHREGEYEYILDCMGMRAQESGQRALLSEFVHKPKLGLKRSKREWYAYLPIHTWDIDYVFDYIAEVEQKPFWTYNAGMSRCSCKLCIMATDADLYTSMNLDLDNFMTYCTIEVYLDETFRMPNVKRNRKTKEIISITKRFLPEVIERHALKYNKGLPTNWEQIKTFLADDVWIMNRMMKIFPKGVPETKQERKKREALLKAN